MDNILQPLPYHRLLCDYLKTRETELWRWFASAESEADYAKQVRMELLKHTYRLEREPHKDIYLLLDEVKAAFKIDDLQVTIYQSQGSDNNAALFYIPGEGHIVLLGSVMTLLSPAEIKSLFGHELAHFLFWQNFDGDYLITDRIISAMTNDVRSENSHFASARLYQLYTEIFCDRGSFHATNDANIAISTLVKVSTGMSVVDPESYLRQANEILAQENIKTEGVTHPEIFIRARAIALYDQLIKKSTDSSGTISTQEIDHEIARMIEGSIELNNLDLIGQVKMTALTRRFLCQLLKYSWLRTDAVLSHLKLFFLDIKNSEFDTADALSLEEINMMDDKAKDYLCYLLIDFATIDYDIYDAAISAIMKIAENTGLTDRLDKLLIKELKIPKRTLSRLHDEMEKTLLKADNAEQEVANVK